MATAFDLRYQMLELAKDYLDKQYNINKEAAQASYELAKEFYAKYGGELPKLEIPQIYSVEQIVKVAEENFNKFVSGNK